MWPTHAPGTPRGAARDSGITPSMHVQHDSRSARFSVAVEGGDAELTYATLADGTLDLRHTQVPLFSQGRGVAGALVSAALAYAREQQVRIVPSCPFVRQWLERHPEAHDVVAPT
ncbi:MAG: hypothetical protein NVS1B4_07720 [Gemmatimonadaceae bacterium]